MDPLIIFYFLIYAGIVSLFVFPISILWLYFRYFKPQARKLNQIIKTKSPLAFLAFDSGKVAMVKLKDIAKQGVLKGERQEEYFVVPQVPLKDGETREDPYERIVTKRFILEDTGCPVFFGYAGKITLLPPAALASIEASDVFSNPGVEEARRFPTLLLDPRKIRVFIERSLSNTQILSIMRDIEDVLRAQYSGREFGKTLIWVMVFLVVAVIVLKVVGAF